MPEGAHRRGEDPRIGNLQGLDERLGRLRAVDAIEGLDHDDLALDLSSLAYLTQVEGHALLGVTRPDEGVHHGGAYGLVHVLLADPQHHLGRIGRPQGPDLLHPVSDVVEASRTERPPELLLELGEFALEILLHAPEVLVLALALLLGQDGIGEGDRRAHEQGEEEKRGPEENRTRSRWAHRSPLNCPRF